MNNKAILYFSAGLNLLLVGYLVLFAGRGSTGESSTRKWTPTENASPSDRAIPGFRLGEATEESTDPSAPSFRWSQIESEDYAKYVKNLRSVGCPEATIRDILEADINQLFESRYAEALTQSPEFDYWRRGPEDAETEIALFGTLALIDEEREALLRSIIGETYEPGGSLASTSRESLVARGKLGFLAPEDREAVIALQAEFDALEREVKFSLSGRENRAELQSELAALRSQRRESLEALLGSDQLLELELRDSEAANRLRTRLTGFDVSEEEFRNLFAEQQAFELARNSSSEGTDPAAMLERFEARRELENSYQEIMGAERYPDWQRQNDQTWQTLKQLEETSGLSRELMGQAYDLRREAERELARATTNGELDEVERTALMEAARAQYQREMAALVGDDASEALGNLPEPRSVQFSTVTASGNASIMMLGTPGAQASASQITDTIVNVLGPSDGGVTQIQTQVILGGENGASLAPANAPVRIEVPPTP